MKLTNNGARRKLFMRPVHCKKTDRLLSIAVCTTEHEVTVDEQILEHFPFNSSGKEIRMEFPGHTMSWGQIILA